MSSETSPAANWAMLSRPAAGKLESFPLKEIAHRAVRIALDSTGARHLLIPTVGKPAQLPADGAAVRFALSPFAFGDDTGMFLDVACPDSSVHDEFDVLIEEVTDRISALDSAAAEALDAIDRWRRFFSLLAKKRLTFVEQMGLMAELSVLDAALDADAGADEFWVGPSKAAHDFEFRGGCVEVKAIGADLDTVEIHGLHQLSEHDGRVLRLVLIEVFEDAAGEDVLSYAADITERHDVDLTKPLAALGLDLDESEGHFATFSVAAARIIPVGHQVPRLVVTAQTPEQDISAVRYRIKISALLPHVVSDDLGALLEEVVNGR